MATRAKSDGTHVALLRGINVGGKNLLPMKDLAALFDAAGASDVRTFIQSGNVVFRAPDALAHKLPALVGARIEKQFGFQPPIVIRSHSELQAITRQNPYLDAGADFDRLLVMFLAEKPTAKAIASLDPARSPPDRFAVVGRDIFLHLPGGVAKTKLTNAWFDSKLSTVSTGRNWRTVLKLLELSQP
jgi:uncharacterized protein (DUF1697 family)